jgi:hypothetical protein
MSRPVTRRSSGRRCAPGRDRLSPAAAGLPSGRARRAKGLRREHPAVGPIAMDCDVIIDGDAELKIVILTAAPDTEDETKLELAFLSGAHLGTLTVT